MTTGVITSHKSEDRQPLVIVLSVLRFMACYYPFGIFKPFLQYFPRRNIYSVKHRCGTNYQFELAEYFSNQ
jgi:hypothetical protein